MSEISEALASLAKTRLERDDESDPDGRIYRDQSGAIYYSVTRILGATAAEHKRLALEKWLERPGSAQDRDIAATRGSLTHNHAEYILKTARKMAIHTAKKRNVLKTASDGLERPPSKITTWAIQKAIQGAPSVPWSAAGFARGLRAWIGDEHITAIHGIEYSVYHPELHYAGTFDALLDVKLTPDSEPVLSLCDWKTSASKNPQMHDYKVQCSAYVLALERLTGLEVPSATIVLARRTGAPIVEHLDSDDLKAAGFEWVDRVNRFLEERENLKAA